MPEEELAEEVRRRGGKSVFPALSTALAAEGTTLAVDTARRCLGELDRLNLYIGEDATMTVVADVDSGEVVAVYEPGWGSSRPRDRTRRG